MFQLVRLPAPGTPRLDASASSASSSCGCWRGGSVGVGRFLLDALAVVGVDEEAAGDAVDAAAVEVANAIVLVDPVLLAAVISP